MFSTTVEFLMKLMIKERISYIFLEHGVLNVKENAFCFLNQENRQVFLPVGTITCIILQPGVTITHAAIVLAAKVGCLILWVGESSVRLYSAGYPSCMRSDKLLQQAKLALDCKSRLRVARKMFFIRFNEEIPMRRSIEQLRGIEGSKVCKLYESFASEYKVKWLGRQLEWEKSDIVNKCITTGNSCLYAICEAAILISGYSSSIGFIHTGNIRSFVFDIADIFKFKYITPLAFEIASKDLLDPIKEIRLKCRDFFRETNFLEKIIPTIEEVLN
jgi:CRISPR-associated protein Cas1